MVGLQQLDVSGCESLSCLPKSISALAGLEQLRMVCCPSLK